MLRVLATAAVAFTAIHTSPPLPAIDSRGVEAAAADIRALMAEAATAPPLTCLLAARSIGNGGWWRGDVPVHPLAIDDAALTWEHNRTLADADVAFLLAELQRGGGCTRELAIRLLANDGGETVRLGLHRLLRDDDPGLVAVAALGAGLLHERASVEPLLAATGNPSAIARVNVTWALGWIGDSRAYPALERALGDGDARVRTAAAGALGRIDTTAAVAALIERLGRDDVAVVRRAAAWALGQLDATDALGALGRALARDGDAAVREMSAWAIGNIDRPGADPALLEAARRDASRDVREMAVWALGVRDDRSHAEALGAIIAGERDARVRATAAWALGVIDPATAPRGLIDAVRDADEDVRQRAAWALSEIGDSSALPAIREALARDNNDRTQRALLRALIRSGEGEERLVQMFDSPDARVREMVARSLAGKSRIDPWPWPQPRPRPFP
jgi:HEAT repeat protein